MSQAEQALRDGDPEQALRLLTDQIRANPGDAKLRVFLFQLLCVLGRWDRALNQLNVAGELDASTLAMVQTYREALQCERLRAQVFTGEKLPMLFGEPEPWTALLLEALLREGRGEAEAAQALRAQAFEQAPACPGTADGQAFEWLADADMRLGPLLEAVLAPQRAAPGGTGRPARQGLGAGAADVQERRRDGGPGAHPLRGHRPERA
jgi:type VI secretion system protein ImpE